MFEPQIKTRYASKEMADEMCRRAEQQFYEEYQQRQLNEALQMIKEHNE